MRNELWHAHIFKKVSQAWVREHVLVELVGHQVYFEHPVLLVESQSTFLRAKSQAS